MALRSEVLALYRRSLRLGQTWKSATGLESNTQEEREYILQETRRLFRKNKDIANEEDIKEHIREGSTRIDLALHYEIPYPRIVNIPQNVLAPTSAKLKRRQKKQIEQSKPIYWKSYKDTNAKDNS